MQYTAACNEQVIGYRPTWSSRSEISFLPVSDSSFSIHPRTPFDALFAARFGITFRMHANAKIKDEFNNIDVIDTYSVAFQVVEMLAYASLQKSIFVSPVLYCGQVGPDCR